MLTKPWPAGQNGGYRDQVIYCQYRDDRTRRTLRGIGEQVAKAEQAVAGTAPVKRNRFIQLSGGLRSVNRELKQKARTPSRSTSACTARPGGKSPSMDITSMTRAESSAHQARRSGSAFLVTPPP